jgi:tricorn protease
MAYPWPAGRSTPVEEGCITMRLKIAITVLSLCLAATTASAEVDARMLRYPDVSATHIAFVYAGDIWTVEKGGGVAHRLSSPSGEELFPRFSPDGARLAFTANYDGNSDVYIIPAMGGSPVRLTHHPDEDLLSDWSPDGERILFSSRRASGIRRLSQFYLVSPDGGFPTELPVPYGVFGAIDPSGRSIAYSTRHRGFRTWKRFRGGTAPDIWHFDLETLEARNLTDSAANDAYPMWHGDTLYFLSDRGPALRSNIWALEPSGEMRQVTHFTDFDITFPAIGPSDIVFQAGGRLYLLSLDDEQIAEVEVEIITDLASVRPQRINASSYIENADISPHGKRVVIEARGELFSVPAKHGVVQNLSRTSGAAERFPAWSPDGKHIAYWSDESGEYELTLVPSAGGEPKVLTGLGPGFRYRIYWSPDSSKVAFIDHTQVIRVYTLPTDTFSEVDKGLWMLHPGLQDFAIDWSSDSRWIAYSRGLETGNSAIFLFDTSNGTCHQVTSGYFSDSGPVFDPDGKFLYYLSNRSLEPIYSDIDATWIYPNTTRIVAAPLQGDVPSPLAPRNDQEAVKDEDEADEKAEETEEKSKREKEGKKTDEKQGSAKDDKKPKPVKIDLGGFEERIVVLPPEAGNYANLAAVSGKIIFHRMPRSGSADENRPIAFYDLEEREEETIIGNAIDFSVAANGKKMLVRSRDTFAIVDIKPDQEIGGNGNSDNRVDTSKLEMVLDPQAEWRQLFTEVWRTYRDYFYDPNLHGLDWDALRNHYGALLDDAITRWDVNFIIGELIGEVNASHTYVGGGDLERAPRRPVGLLGIDWALENGAYRVARIVGGAPWDGGEVRSPLAEPGVDIAEGDYILAVNGVPIDTSKDPFAAFQDLGEQTVALTVNSKPSVDGSREVLVETLASESRLRNLEWIEHNRQRVLEASDGRIGYIYVPDTSVPGQTELVRQLNSQIRLPGLIIDERFNAGGQLPDRFIEKVNRQMVSRIFFRHGATRTHPSVTHYGAKAMLINGWAGSGGDAFPWFFKEMDVGPLVGERTWGGLIGPAVGHRLIDGGRYTAPPGRLFSVNGEWFPEGHGVDPDIPVVDHPTKLAKGIDPQLEAAISAVLELIVENPPVFAKPPEFEVR